MKDVPQTQGVRAGLNLFSVLRIARRISLGQLVPWCLLIGSLWLVWAHTSRPAYVLELCRPWAQIGILAVAMSAIILTGGIDLSVGSMVALCGMALGVLWSRFGWPVEWAAAAAVTVGIAAGAGNGLLVILGIPPLVATLATMAFYAGLAMALARGERIAGWPDHFIWLGQGKLFGVPTQLILLAFALLAGYVIVHHSRWGRWLYAFGDNPIAARFAAVPVGPLQWILYTTSGLAAGLTAVVYTAHQGAAVPDAGTGLELRTIACVVVGGTRVTGGSGGILNTLLGLVIMALLDIGLGFIESLTIPGLGLRWEFRAQHRQIVIGLLVIAVAVWNERAVRRTDS